MMHPGVAPDLARALQAERSRRSFDRSLSLVGAVTLLATVLIGPVGALAAAAGAAAAAVAPVAAAWLEERRGRTWRPADRWQPWRWAEPDPEYLRGRPA